MSQSGNFTIISFHFFVTIKKKKSQCPRLPCTLQSVLELIMLTEGAFTFALFVTHLQNTLSFGRFLCGLKNGSATMKLMASVRLNLCDNL